jgi:hypothetical protein
MFAKKLALEWFDFHALAVSSAVLGRVPPISLPP